MSLVRHNAIIFCLCFMMTETPVSFAQHLSSPRGISIGAFTSLSKGITSLDWNPAGLISIREWEIITSNYVATSGHPSGITLYSIGVGKKFFGDQVAAVAYSPGKVLEFIAPTTFSVFDSNGNVLLTKFDKKITFSQTYSFGYGYQFPDNFSIGLNAKFFESRVSDTKYSSDENNVIQSQIKDYSASQWTIDFGALYSVNSLLSLGFIVKNLFILREEELSEDVRDFRLNLSKLARLGIAYNGFSDASLSFEVDTKKNFRLGSEFNPLNELQIRGGLYSGQTEHVEAAAFGIGVSFSQIKFDISYLKFFQTMNRSGTISTNTFLETPLVDIDYTPFTGDRISLSANIDFGIMKETLARIEYVEMLNEVFSSSPTIYAFRPLGKARVRNISTKPIEAKVSFYIDELMSAPTETKAYPIPSNEVLEIPFFAVFNQMIERVKKFSVYDGTVYVHAKVSEDYDDRYQTRVLVRGRNDWDGDVLLLKYFVTPNDPDILQYSRSVLNRHKTHFDTVVVSLQNFEKAKVMFNSFAEQLRYVHDPKSSKDFVQYPSETLSLHGGDCDDLTVCYAALLMSMGISTSFVDVLPPDHPEDAHIYLLFDTGIIPQDAHYLANNPKRYVVRRNIEGKETLWIPVETTVIAKGFQEAWNLGAEQYFQDAEINFGIAKGWMRVVDLQPPF